MTPSVPSGGRRTVSVVELCIIVTDLSFRSGRLPSNLVLTTWISERSREILIGYVRLALSITVHMNIGEIIAGQLSNYDTAESFAFARP